MMVDKAYLGMYMLFALVGNVILHSVIDTVFSRF